MTNPLAQVKEALTPFVNFAALLRYAPDDAKITAGSTFAATQITAREFRKLAIALPALDTLGEELVSLQEMVNNYSQERAPEAMEVLASDRDRWFDRAEKAKAEVVRQGEWLGQEIDWRLKAEARLAQCQDALGEIVNAVDAALAKGSYPVATAAEKATLTAIRATADAALSEATTPAGEHGVVPSMSGDEIIATRHDFPATSPPEREAGQYETTLTPAQLAEWEAANQAAGYYRTVAPPEREGVDWRHIANEWADAATNGIQWLRNVRDGVSCTQDGIDEMEANVARIRGLSQAATPTAPTPDWELPHPTSRPTAPDRAADALRAEPFEQGARDMLETAMGINIGSPLHMVRMLLDKLDTVRAALSSGGGEVDRG